LQKSNIQFALELVKDASKLDWTPEQLGRRKRVLLAVLEEHSDSLTDMERSLLHDGKLRDLLDKKGWNKVNSGFRLFGNGKSTEYSDDEFLASKGWNDVDSGFRLF